jgi:iron complex transport system substrate-binding protein
LSKTGNDFAVSFEIRDSGAVSIIDIFNPWQGATNAKLTYLFSDSLSAKNIIHVPVNKIVCFSSSHVAYLSALEMQQRIAGISGLRFISDSVVMQMKHDHLVTEVGYEDNINYDFFSK